MDLQIINKTFDNTYEVYDYDTGKLSIFDHRCYNKHTFYIPKNFIYDKTSDITKYQAYAEKLIGDRNQLLKFRIYSTIKFDVFDKFLVNDGKIIYQTNASIVTKLFNILCKKEYKCFDQISYTEFQYFEKTNNSGLMFCLPGKYVMDMI